MNFFLVVVLHAEYDAKVYSVLVPVLLQHVDKVIEDVWVEQLNVLDDEYYRSVDSYAFSLNNLLDTKERLFREIVIILCVRSCIVVGLVEVFVLVLAPFYLSSCRSTCAIDQNFLTLSVILRFRLAFLLYVLIGLLLILNRFRSCFNSALFFHFFF